MKHILIFVFFVFVSAGVQAQAHKKCKCDDSAVDCAALQGLGECINEIVVHPPNLDNDSENECSSYSYEDCVIYMASKCGDEIKIDNRVALVFESEDADLLQDNRFNHSIGNGNETVGLNSNGWGHVVPYTGQIVAVTMGNRTTSTSVSQFQLTVNTALTGPGLALPASTATQVWPVSIPVAQGDVINFYTISGNNISDSAISITVRACIE